jgi:hypothetical protein
MASESKGSKDSETLSSSTQENLSLAGWSSQWIQQRLSNNLEWITRNLTWQKLKPVIRSSISAWVSLVLLLVPQTEKAMGLAAFLILISTSCYSPTHPKRSNAYSCISFSSERLLCGDYTARDTASSLRGWYMGVSTGLFLNSV